MIDDFTREELRSGLTSYVQKITMPDRRAGHNMYKCPLCGSGNNDRRDSDGAFSITPDGKAWKCFSCNQGGDIFTLISLHEGITDFLEQAKRAAEVTGVRLDLSPRRPSAKEDFSNLNEPKEAPQEPIKGKYKEYIKRCQAAASKTNYFTERGFTPETVKRFSLGYDEQARVIVIPYDKDGSYYLTRSTEGKTFRKPKSKDAGIEPIYNKQALYIDDKPCFVCESPIDAISLMSISDGSYRAIALGGTGHRKLIDQVTKEKPSCMLILSFDTDDPGQKATENAAEDLREKGIPFIVANYTLEAYPENARKDPNDLLRGNQAQLAADIKESIEEAERLANAEKIALLEAHYANSAAARLESFNQGIKTEKYIPTGFSELDKELDGGLYNGLYILGAISSMGKTTLLLQMADQIASGGNDILYFSLEMAATELISKSLSRISFMKCNGNTQNAKTGRGITTASRYSHYSQEEKALIALSIDTYKEYAHNIIIYEGMGNIGVDQIKQAVTEHIALTGKTPVVFIDYLQILAPYDMRATDKQNTDKAVLELKRLSRDYKTPVVALSSFNRDNYTSEANMSAFKESGAIEYGSDVLIALQAQGMKPGYGKTDQKYNVDLVKKCKRSAERSIEAVILKNRNGKTGGKVGFIYYSLFNCFNQDYGFVQEEMPDIDDEDDFLPPFENAG
ncbi:MAG: toprim domain-containing protein [Lachnospiraceae bacterium]|nr:toprim domain-containing protein [Lachnospiraceae bacterium]